ncbi:MAG TPA: biotin--[acetyl-CoA-carboxylase] ligase [Dehalococcoidia bacterium]|nr:biotin--[acetyl-CoA-carboxylase] ligase [Dehalococcoidia bacterium]
MSKDSLSPSAITTGLGTRFVGQRVLYYPKLSSTMDIARKEARRGIAEGTVVIAEEQTVGRGRLKRTWLSPQGSIALSIILYPRISYLPYLVMLAALAAARSIEKVTGLKTQLKWPNDVLINGKKVCGILVETEVGENSAAYAIIGIGINVNFKVADFPEILDVATSLADELGRDIPRVKIIRQLLAEVEELCSALPDGEPIYQEWRKRLITLGRKVQVRTSTAILEGIAESVARDGSLLLRQADGSQTRIVAGDVTLR